MVFKTKFFGKAFDTAAFLKRKKKGERDLQRAREQSGLLKREGSGLIQEVRTIEDARFNIAKQKSIDAEQRRQEGVTERNPPLGKVGDILDIGTAALGQPLKTIRAIFDPRITLQQTTRQFFEQSTPKQILDLGLTGLSIGSAGLLLKAFTAAPKVAVAATKVAGRGSTAVITRTATSITTNPATITTQRAFQVSGKTASTLANMMSNLGQLTASSIVKQGIGLAWKFKGRTIGIITAVTGAQMLWTWFAVDNVMTGASIYARDTAEAVRFGVLSRGEAIAGLDEAQKRVNQAKRFAQIQSLNPLIAIFSRNIRNGITQTQAQIELQYRLLGVKR